MSYYIIGLLLSLMSWACSDDVETLYVFTTDYYSIFYR